MTQPKKRTTTLKALIKRANLTQRRLSDQINVTEKNINDWVRGVSYPRLDRAADLARALGVTLKELCEAIGISTEGIPDLPTKQSADDAANIPSASEGGDL